MRAVQYIFLAALLGLFSASVSAGIFGMSVPADDIVTFEYESEIYNRINRERVRTKRSLLVWDEKLAEIARSYSREMATNNFFDHSDPFGRMVQDRIESARIRNWRKVGENLFWVENRKDFSAMAVRLWMGSDSHRENILDREWKSTGIGVWRSDTGRYYVTQIFLSE